MATGCALGAGGILKNASDIEFYESEADSHPIRSRTTQEEPEKIHKTGLFMLSLHCNTVLMFYVWYFQADDLGKGPKEPKWLNTSPRNT